MAVRLGLLSTYPSTQCGIATFCEALATQLVADGADVGVVRVVDEPQPGGAPVVHQWVTGERGGAAAVAAVLDAYDVAVVQHEYGIFGGPDGEDVLEVVARVHVPVVTVLHTVLTHPSPNQHRVLAALVARSDALVVMTRTAEERLLAGWAVDPARVSVIPHGAADNRPPAHPAASTGAPPAPPAPRTTRSPRVPARPTVLTWGLLSQGKGIEWALHAMAGLRGRIAAPTYRVVGQTHPRVLEHEGEVYRQRLLQLTRDLRLTGSVEFDGRYLSGPALREVVRRADVVLLPYDSLDQVTSGVLTEAVVAGKPVISTSFPHAVELLSGGAGVLVPRRDPGALADALVHVLAGEGVATAMAAAASGLAASLLWPAVSRRYLHLAATLVTATSPATATATARPLVAPLPALPLDAVVDLPPTPRRRAVPAPL
ncbi:glycosyltransferase [Cellulomonas endophytica]|uniref:glycosyltransferase n=1 Tax=Cellulomonas endophytica TaxID=2494735 RepID=UPI0010111BB9|nr:glycosyltransferase [Cellulomonas endophytica]